MRVEIELGLGSVRSSTTLHVTPEYVDNSMLYFFRDSDKIHIISTSRRTLYLKAEKEEHMRTVCHEKIFNQTYLQIVAIILIESLQTLDQQEIGSEPCEQAREERSDVNVMTLKNK
jgi:hypothetical protein